MNRVACARVACARVACARVACARCDGGAPKFQARAKAGELVTLVDMDHFIEGKFDPNAEWVTARAGDVIPIIVRDGERVQSINWPWQQALMRSMLGSAGVVVLISGYAPYLPHVGTSPAVFDSRRLVRSSTAPAREAPSEGTRTITRQAVLRMSSADQAREVMAALNLNKTQLADVLGVSRPTLYDWLDGKEPNAANAQRLTGLVQLLVSGGVTAADSISPRFVRESLEDGEPSLLELLKADPLDEARVAKVLAQAKELEADAGGRRRDREHRLRALGFEEPTAEQRKENLALNVALREWPKDRAGCIRGLAARAEVSP